MLAELDARREIIRDVAWVPSVPPFAPRERFFDVLLIVPDGAEFVLEALGTSAGFGTTAYGFRDGPIPLPSYGFLQTSHRLGTIDVPIQTAEVRVRDSLVLWSDLDPGGGEIIRVRGRLVLPQRVQVVEPRGFVGRLAQGLGLA